MPRSPDMPCAGCGTLIWRGTSSLPEGKATCRPCRSLRPKREYDYRTPCVDCSEPSSGERCRSCADKVMRRFRPDDDPRVRRYDREKSAPGMTRRERDALMALWRRQRRACAYCPAPATTMDHVVPLVRGGTNHEGNLTPCCRRCNGSKAGWLLTEWRHGRKPELVVDTATWAVTVTRRVSRPKVWAPAMPMSMCPGCHALHVGAVYCSKECSTEVNRVRMRNRYRERVGIPLDQPVRSHRSKRAA